MRQSQVSRQARTLGLADGDDGDECQAVERNGSLDQARDPAEQLPVPFGSSLGVAILAVFEVGRENRSAREDAPAEPYEQADILAVGSQG